jgi:uncharacterized protein
MQISRLTFQNIIDSAQKKVALALSEGKAIRIGGGHYTTNQCKFKCMACGETYAINFGQDKDAYPKCKSENVVCSKKADFCTKWCRSNNIPD